MFLNIDFANVTVTLFYCFVLLSFEVFRPSMLSKPPEDSSRLSYASVTQSSNNNNTGAPKGQAAPKKSPSKPPQTSREDHRVLVTLPSACQGLQTIKVGLIR